MFYIQNWVPTTIKVSADGHTYQNKKGGYNYDYNVGRYNNPGHSKQQSGAVDNWPLGLHVNPGQYESGQWGTAKQHGHTYNKCAHFLRFDMI